MLRESINTPPRRNDNRVKEFLASSRPLQPQLPDKQQHRQHNPIPNKCTPHNEMRQALPQMIVSTEPQCRDPAKQHLHPRGHRQRFPKDTVRRYEVGAYASENAALEVQAQVDAE
jgi:hypothetical protein